MSAVMIVELLSKSGAVRERHRFDTFPVSIGRGYGNTLVLEDDFMSLQHGAISVNEQGALIYRDLTSENGSLLAGQRVYTLELQADQTLVLGETTLRLRTPDCVLPPTRLLDRASDLLLWPPGWLRALAVALLLSATGAALAWGLEFKEPQPAQAVGFGLLVLLGLALWAGGWALLGRLFVQRTSFRAHLTVAALMGLALLLLDQLTDPLGMMLNPVPGIDTLLLLLSLLPAWLGLGLHLRLATHLSRRQALLRTLGALVAVGVVGGVLDYAHSREYEPKPEMNMDASYVPVAWLPAQTPAQFFKDADQLRQQAK